MRSSASASVAASSDPGEQVGDGSTWCELPRRRGGLAVHLVALGGKAPALRRARAAAREAILEHDAFSHGAQLRVRAPSAARRRPPSEPAARGASLVRRARRRAPWARAWRWPRAPAGARAGRARPPRAAPAPVVSEASVLVAFAVLWMGFTASSAVIVIRFVLLRRSPARLRRSPPPSGHHRRPAQRIRPLCFRTPCAAMIGVGIPMTARASWMLRRRHARCWRRDGDGGDGAPRVSSPVDPLRLEEQLRDARAGRRRRDAAPCSRSSI